MQTEIAVLGGGCFWCTEAIYQELRGIISVEPGYAGGHIPNPTYEQVSAGDSGHVEVIRIEFDPSQITYQDLLEIFFSTHNPTTPNQQGNDSGPQYQSTIFYTNESQHAEAQQIIKDLTAEEVFDRPISTDVKKLDAYYKAEDYHHNYYKNNPTAGYCQAIITPKLQKFREKYAQLLKQ